MPAELLDLSEDYLVWDGVEAITIELRRQVRHNPVDDPQLRHGQANPAYEGARKPQSFSVWPIPVAKRRALGVRELAASGGAYTGQDLTWHLPQHRMPQGLSLKPGDVVCDRDGRRWTALEVAHNKLRQTWKLTCRDLVLHYDLRDLIAIERPQIEYDAAGVAVQRFPSTHPKGGIVLYQDLPANVQLLSQEIVHERAIEDFRGNYAVTVGRELDVQHDDRILLADGRILDIVGYHNAQRLDELPVIDAQLRP